MIKNLTSIFVLLLCFSQANADNFVSFYESTESKSSVDCLAEAMYFEARGDGKFGMYIVGEVIRNRVEDSTYEFRDLNNYCDVVHQPSRDSSRPWLCAFSYYCDGKPEVYDLDNVSHVDAVNMSYKIASIIINETQMSRMDFTENALYYTQHKVSKDWMERTEVTLVFKGHTFRKPISKEVVVLEEEVLYTEEQFELFSNMSVLKKGGYFSQVEASYLDKELLSMVSEAAYKQMEEKYKELEMKRGR